VCSVQPNRNGDFAVGRMRGKDFDETLNFHQDMAELEINVYSNSDSFNEHGEG
jgi:hypothetical protein